ncbi:MAG: 30S ribosome-binding factor RbfA, partial [Sphaerochaetaceae bacterium]
MIATQEIKNPNLNSLVAVSEVRLSKDKAYATVLITSLEPVEKLKNSLSALQSASGFIQQRLGTLLQTRHTPRLTFKIDTLFMESQKVNQLLESLKIKDEE